jgi:hypothetical protein
MFRLVVEIGIRTLTGYLAAGAGFAAVFHAIGLKRLDPGATGAGWFFRALITPGVIALWPLLAVKWRRVQRGGEFLGHAQRPATPRRLRQLHGGFIRALAVVLPLAAGAALWFRPAPLQVTSSPGGFAVEPPALPRVLAGPTRIFGDYPIDISLRADATGRRQLEAAVERDLELPALVLFWSADPVTDRLPRQAVFLGTLWGPGTRRYSLPMEPMDGQLSLVSMAEAQRVLVAAPLRAIATPETAVPR